jgi:hypothetical protein
LSPTIEDTITGTLRRGLEAGLAKTCRQGRRRADAALRRHGEGAAADALPQTCPYNWYPRNQRGLLDD